MWMKLAVKINLCVVAQSRFMVKSFRCSCSEVHGAVKEKHHVGFHYGSLKEDSRPGPLCKPCFAKETVGKTVLYIAFWYLAFALQEA